MRFPLFIAALLASLVIATGPVWSRNGASHVLVQTRSADALLREAGVSPTHQYATVAEGAGAHDPIVGVPEVRGVSPDHGDNVLRPSGADHLLAPTITVTESALVLRGPCVVGWEQGTNLTLGFNALAMAESFAAPRPWSILWTSQQGGLFNGVQFALAPGQTWTVPASLLPANGLWRLTVDGVMRTSATGNRGYEPLDVNLDSFVDGIDYDEYIRLFEAGDLRADWNNDEFVNGIDRDRYENAWEDLK